MNPVVCSGGFPTYFTDLYNQAQTSGGCAGVSNNGLGGEAIPQLTHYYRDRASAKRVNSQLSTTNAAVPASGTITLRGLAGTTCMGIKQASHSLSVTIASGNTSLSNVSFFISGANPGVNGVPTTYT